MQLYREGPGDAATGELRYTHTRTNAPVELVGEGEEGRVQEVQEPPELVEIILQGGPSQQEHVLEVHPPHGLREARLLTQR